MAKASKDEDQEYDDAEIARRRDEVVKRMLNTPPQPKRGKPKDKPAPKPKAKKPRE